MKYSEEYKSKLKYKSLLYATVKKIRKNLGNVTMKTWIELSVATLSICIMVTLEDGKSNYVAHIQSKTEKAGLNEIWRYEQIR